MCPFCLVVNSIESEHIYTRQHDIVYHDADVTALIAATWWRAPAGQIPATS